MYYEYEGVKMDIKTIKQQIETNNIPNHILIFKYINKELTSKFLCYQYLNEIIKIKNINVEYVSDISYINTNNTLFGDIINDYLIILTTDKFNSVDITLLNTKNIIIVCNDTTSECESIFMDYIVQFPKLETWQIKDYVYSTLNGVDKKYLDRMIDLCNFDIFRLDKEIEKLKLFTITEQPYIFQELISDGNFDDLSNETIFNLTNAILKKDKNALVNIYTELNKIDCEPLGVVTILLNNIKNIIKIQLSPHSSPESCGLPTNKYWAIRKNVCGYYNRNELINCFLMLNNLDKQLKTGELEVSYFIDYIICHMLS